MRRGLRPARLVPGVLAAVACAGPGVPVSEFPEDPIALHYYDVATLRRRSDALADADPATRRRASLGVAHLRDVSGYMGRLLGSEAGGSEPESLDGRFPGRLAFLDPRSGEVELAPGTLSGAIPRARSADGERLMFTQLVGRFRQLKELDRGTGEVRSLSRGPAVHADGCYGPEGRTVLASARVRDGRPVSRIEITRAGGPPEALSEGPADYAPACAPDGSAVAWVAVDERGRDQLMSRSPALEGPIRRLGLGRSPAFSPDSRWIVYSAPVGDRWALHRIRVDGSARRPVGRGQLDELDPSFSPDGRLVVYVSDDGFERRIFVRRFDGSGDRVLLESGGGTDPVW